ncbi:protein-L-isoaspartate O-methyltransferase [Methylobacterium sp. Leaf399]|uniref:protein-L-isoaspartate O-methyltransferase family protein n=1 Tax=Methylobacterium sp. Leaf399 TaxID=1736364 RepID=UPI0006F23EA7|nr:methyltransferase domain-containing protein [Methylobacterium sp. Leaf399]KQT07923.1 protein-L-isoaspartate O-methyltransferase [Methylobacterium sp. Leaf399]
MDHEAGAIEDAAFVLAMRGHGVRDTAVLRAMERVPRERFAPERHRHLARRDIALPLACGQTMTAPTAIAAMLTALSVQPGARVLEIGTGSGYVTALLVNLGAAHVRSIERYASLGRDARERLEADGLDEAVVEIGDGLAHRPGDGPFDRILVSGICPALPAHLAESLAPGGRLVTAVGRPEAGRLLRVERGPDGALVHRVGTGLRIAPLTPGRAAMV